MSLNAELLVHRGDFTLDAALQVGAGETLAILGPNGSGKSTLLAAIAGVLTPTRGTVDVSGRMLTGVGGVDTTIAVAPHLRKIGLLGQDPFLFPHLSALENIAFGRRSAGQSAALARENAAMWLDAVGLAGFGKRRPAELSGGQQQRVAIARALAANPDVLLLDEPMAALDVQNATMVRTLLRERLAAATLSTVVVTHDIVDAMVLADRVAIVDAGRIVDVGDVATVLGQPVNLFAATLVGLNLVEGTMGADGCVHTAHGRRLQGGGPPDGRLSGEPAGRSVMAVFPPTAVRLSTVSAASGDQLSWRATVGPLEPAQRGIRVPFLGDSVVAELTAAELLGGHVREGAVVSVSVDPGFVTVYPSRNVLTTMGG